MKPKTTSYLLLVFGISYSLAAIFWFAGGELASLPGLIFSVAYMFIPMLSVLIVEKVLHREPIKVPLLISFRFNVWFLIAWLIPPVLMFTTIGISILFPDVIYSPEVTAILERFAKDLTPEQLEQSRFAIQQIPVHPMWTGLVQGLLAGITINAVAAFGEELGWRGFLVRQFSGMTFIKASLITGVIWGLWHAPMILMGHNYPDHPVAGVLMMTVWCTLLSPLFLFITLQARSVIAASVMHGTLNGIAGLAILVVDGGSDLTIGLTGLAGFLALILALAVMFLYDIWISKKSLTIKTIDS